MEFKKEGRRVVLRGTQKIDLEWMGTKRFQQTMQKSGQLFAIQIWPAQPDLKLCSAVTTDPEIQKLLGEFADIFE